MNWNDSLIATKNTKKTTYNKFFFYQLCEFDQRYKVHVLRVLLFDTFFSVRLSWLTNYCFDSLFVVVGFHRCRFRRAERDQYGNWNYLFCLFISVSPSFNSFFNKVHFVELTKDLIIRCTVGRLTITLQSKLYAIFFSLLFLHVKVHSCVLRN